MCFDRANNRPRVWFRDLFRSDQLFHLPESLATTRFRLHGELKDVEVEARAHQRMGEISLRFVFVLMFFKTKGNGWKMNWMKVTLLDEPKREFILCDKQLQLPQNMTTKKS
jgi:hypothetical protein